MPRATSETIAELRARLERAEREVRTLENLLVASLAQEAETDLGAAIADYRTRRFPEIIARRLSDRLARPLEDDLGDHARGADVQRVAHRLGHV